VSDLSQICGKCAEIGTHNNSKVWKYLKTNYKKYPKVSTLIPIYKNAQKVLEVEW
jgi:hypothetical protein